MTLPCSNRYVTELLKSVYVEVLYMIRVNKP